MLCSSSTRSSAGRRFRERPSTSSTSTSRRTSTPARASAARPRPSRPDTRRPKPLPNNTYFWRVRPINAQGARRASGPRHVVHPVLRHDPADRANGPTISGLHVRDDAQRHGTKPAGLGDLRHRSSSGIRSPEHRRTTSTSITMTNGVCDIQSRDHRGLSRHYAADRMDTAWLRDTGRAISRHRDHLRGERARAHARDSLLRAHPCRRGDEHDGHRVYRRLHVPRRRVHLHAESSGDGPVALPTAADYLSPTGGVDRGQTPLYTWKPIPGANSYWVIVARDPSFTTLVDYGFTQIPAYAPRRTIADENDRVLLGDPAGGQRRRHRACRSTPIPVGRSTRWARAQPTSRSARRRRPCSRRPTARCSPRPSRRSSGRPVTTGSARNYRLQVSTDPNFGTLLDNVVTASTAYVSTTTYPAQSTLYWRVQANDGDGIALTWSSTGTFKQVLPTPQPLTQQAASGDLIPRGTGRRSPARSATTCSVVLPGWIRHRSTRMFRLRRWCRTDAHRHRCLPLAGPGRLQPAAPSVPTPGPTRSSARYLPDADERLDLQARPDLQLAGTSGTRGVRRPDCFDARLLPHGRDRQDRRNRARLEPQRVHQGRRTVLLARRGGGRRRQSRRVQPDQDLQDPQGKGGLVPRPSRADGSPRRGQREDTLPPVVDVASGVSDLGDHRDDPALVGTPRVVRDTHSAGVLPDAPGQVPAELALEEDRDPRERRADAEAA